MWRAPGFARLLVANVCARLPVGMLGLAVLLCVLERTGSLAAAGTVVAVVTLGQALSGPLTSTLAVRWGVRRVVLVSASISAFATVGLAVPTPLPMVAALGFVAGLATPPILALTRAAYPAIVAREDISVAMALDASSQETIWIASPIVVVAVGAALGSPATLALAAALTLGGAVWFVWALPAVGDLSSGQGTGCADDVSDRPRGARALVVVATVIGALLIAACSCAEAGVVAHLGSSTATGFVLASFSIGSMAGGLLLGTARVSAGAIVRRLTLVGCGLAIAGAVSDPVGLGLALLIAGLGVAPTLAARVSMIAAILPRERVATASGWLTAGQLAGGGIGTALAGVLADGVGAQSVAFAALGFIVAAGVVALVCARVLPDLGWPPIGAESVVVD